MTAEPAQILPQDRTSSPPVTLAFFYSPRSGRSRRTEGFLAQVLQHRKNHDTFRLLRVDVDERPDLAGRFRIAAIPTLLVIVDNRVCGRLSQPTGVRPITKLLSPWLR
jgi:thioredoxin-like negative regulator of GroEL